MLTAKQVQALTPGKVVCVGRNYAAHARELENPVPDSPIFFIKPGTAVTAMAPVICLPHPGVDGVHYPCHYECELALLVGQRLHRASAEEVNQAIVAVGLGLDLTLRDLQSDLKRQGHPWDKAKAFDGACPLSSWVMLDQFGDYAFDQWQSVEFSFSINGVEKQRGCPSQMLTPIPDLVSEMSYWFTLAPGDVVLTGTPAGVGPLAVGDTCALSLYVADQAKLDFMTQVIRV